MVEPYDGGVDRRREPEPGCITCSDEGVVMRVVECADPGVVVCVDEAEHYLTVMTGLVGAVWPGDRLLVRAGTALVRLDGVWGRRA